MSTDGMAPIPNLEFSPPDCPRCERETEPDYGTGGYRCDRCRIAWDAHGTRGTPDPRPPLDRLRDAHDAHARTDISTAEFSDRVYEFLGEAEDVRDTVHDIAVTDLSVIRDVVEQAAPGYLGQLDAVIARLREVSQ